MFWVGETGQASQPNPLTSGRGGSLLGGDLSCTGWLVSSVPRHTSIPWGKLVPLLFLRQHRCLPVARTHSLPLGSSSQVGRPTPRPLPVMLTQLPPTPEGRDHARGAHQHYPSPSPDMQAQECPLLMQKVSGHGGPGEENPQLQLAGRCHCSSGPRVSMPLWRL